MMKIAIVGAGIAGLSCAVRLGQNGHRVTVFDKGRGAGGRMATRRIETPLGDISFDHGAQYFTARDADFLAALSAWEAGGIVARWPAAGSDAWVGTPGMNAILRHLAAQTEVHWNQRVEGLLRDGDRWQLDGVDGDEYDTVIVAIPAEQAPPLLSPHDPAMANEALACRSSPCWTAMLAFATPLAVPHDVIRDAGIIGWAARNSAKPGRDGPEAWVVQAGPAWSRTHLEDPVDTVVDMLIDALAEQAGGVLPPMVIRTGHRWRYARTIANDLGCLWNPEQRLGTVGDWLIAPRIESAWLSGRLLAERISPFQ